MSEWVKAKRELKKEFRKMEKEVKDYSYKDPEHAEKTDEAFRKILAQELNKSREIIFPMIESAYKESDMKNAGALEDVMQWIDVFLLETGLPLEWNKDADHMKYRKLIKLDVTILDNTRKLNGILEKMGEKATEGGSGSAVKKCAQLKNYVSDLLRYFKRRRHSLGE